MNLRDLHKVWEIRALKKPGEEDARQILDRITKHVQPIMHRRKWRVKLLSEFCPANPSLLGLNVGVGVEVKLRLRRPNQDWDFFPFEQVLDTMLHELCHIEHGPHNAQFYKLWDELRKECDDLVAKGITGTGEGFDGFGRRLGGFSRQPPVSSLRQTALAAAQKRARVGALQPSGPRRLGGDDVIMSALSPIQAAAMAAERRMKDDLWCGSGSQEIERINDLEAIGESSNSCSSTPPSSFSAVHNIEGKVMWACRVCIFFFESKQYTFSCINCFDVKYVLQPLAPICEACGTRKPKPLESNYKTWSCKFCTLENTTKLDKCSACEQWRYSYGPPPIMVLRGSCS